jgi:hypothetical protein
MSWRVLLVSTALLLAGAVAVASAAQSDPPTPTVKPGAGGPHTKFVVSFKAPQSTGRSVRYVVSAHMRSHPRHCISASSAEVTNASAGSIVHVPLNPRAGRGHWCRGVFNGEVMERFTDPCPPLELCPALVIRPQSLGSFTFRVHRRHR